MNTELLTAYNEDIQRYIERPNKATKQAIIDDIKRLALKRGINFNRLFPANTKRYQVLDEIIYLLSVGGICTAESKTLARRTGSSVRTVSDAVKNIKELDLFVVGGLADGNNKYVFVYKEHDDFNEIIANVFYVNPADLFDDNAEQIAERRNVASVDNAGVVDNKKRPILNNLFKQDKHINKAIKESIENEIVSGDQDEKAREYLHNPTQYLLYERIKSDDYLHDDIRKEALRLALRAGSNLDYAMFSKALVTLRRIDKFITLGGHITHSIPALFDRIYRDRIRYDDYYKQRNRTAIRRDNSDILRYNPY